MSTTGTLKRSGLSLVEVLIGAVIIGVSALPVLELVRSGTAQLEISEIEAAARQLGADLLERVAGPSIGTDKGLPKAFEGMKSSPIRWDDVIQADAALKKDFAIEGLRSLLDQADVRLELTIKSPFEHPVLGPAKELEAFIVTVHYTDRNDVRKKVTFARLVDLD